MVPNGINLKLNTNISILERTLILRYFKYLFFQKFSFKKKNIKIGLLLGDIFAYLKAQLRNGKHKLQWFTSNWIRLYFFEGKMN